MANLTATLDDATRGKPIIEPAKPGPSFLGGLADLVGNASEVAGKTIEYQNKKNQTDSANDVESGMLGIQKDFQERSQGAAQDEMINQMNTGVMDADKVKKAAQQGKVPLDAVDAKVESLYSSMFSKYPDQRSFIAQYFAARGYDHYLGRELMLAEANRSQQDKDKLDLQHSYFEAAKSAGADPNASYEDNVRMGMQLTKASHLAALAQQTATTALTLSSTKKNEYDLQMSMAKQQSQDSTTAFIGAYGGNVMDSLTQLADKATTSGDPAQWDRLQKEVFPLTLDRASQMYNRFKQNQIATGAAHADSFEYSDKYFDDWKKGITDRFSGDSSYFAADKRSFDNFQQHLQLDAYHAAPQWALVKQVLGPQVAQLLFNGDPTKMLNPDFLKSLEGELKTFNPLHPNKAVSLLTQAGEVLNGNTDITNIKPAEYDAAHLKIFSASMGALAPNTLGPQAKPADRTAFLNGNGAFSVITQRSIQPNYKNVDGWDYAIRNITDRTNTAALVNLQNDKEFGDRAKEVMVTNRAAVAQVLASAQANATGIKLSGGRFIPIPQVDKTAGMIPIGEGSAFGMLPPTASPPTVSPSDKKQAELMNTAVDYLTRTAQYDATTPKEATPAALTAHYQTGAPLPVDSKGNKKQSTTDFNKQVDQFEEGLLKTDAQAHKLLPYKEYRAPVKFSSDEDAAVRTALGEGKTPEERKAVIDVIRNRMKATGMSAREVVMQPGQFEPWMHSETANHLMSIDPNSKVYQETLGLLADSKDSTGGADHFYAPKAQAKLGRNKPEWDNGSGKQIGESLFFSLGYGG